MSSKFFVYGGGRWREVCLESGRVSGWEDSAQFVYRSGQRLQVARRGPVLAGLRALASGAPTTVRNGPRVEQRRHESYRSTKREVPPGSCRHCCKRKSKKKVKDLLQTPASVVKETETDGLVERTKPTFRAAEKDHKHTQFESETTSHKPLLERFSKSSLTKSELIKKSTLIKYRGSSESRAKSVDSVGPIRLILTNHVKERAQTNHVTNSDSNQKSVSQKDLRGNSTSTDESVILVSETRTKTQPQSESAHSYSQNNSQQRTDKEPSRGSRRIAAFISKIIGTNIECISSSDNTNNKRKNNSIRYTIRERTSRVSEPSPETEGSEWSEGHPSDSDSLLPLSIRGKTMCKELTIDEVDVIALRGFLERYTPEDVMLQFDSEDSYKERIFYSINPLVRIKRCPRIAELLRRWEPEPRLADFASQLGLRSVSESSAREPARYRTRRSLATPRSLGGRSGDHADTDKENLKNSGIKKRRADIGPLSYLLSRSSRVSGEKKPTRRTVKTPEKSPTIENVTLSSDSEEALVKKSSPRESPARGRVPRREAAANPKEEPAGKVSKRGQRRGVVEYSTLEDQAIVSWVSRGGRATRVNGNALWRDLHEQYFALTGQRRTWQSLRNRYLRYVLPGLGRLAVPAGRARALRAAAAMGEIKRKRKASRRNSLIDIAEAEAETALARAPVRRRRERGSSSPEHSDAERFPPPKRLRGSGPSARAEPQSAAAVMRKRKLFNPNAVP